MLPQRQGRGFYPDGIEELVYDIYALSRYSQHFDQCQVFHNNLCNVLSCNNVGEEMTSHIDYHEVLHSPNVRVDF